MKKADRAAYSGRIRRTVLVAWMLSVLFCATVWAAPKINAKKAVLPVGGKIQLKVTGLKKGQKIVWKSSKPKVAKVTAKGMVQGKKAGKTLVTATAGGKKYSCTITVKKMAMSRKSCTLNKGGTVKLSLTGLTGSSGVKWKSSKKAVAKVSSDGTVKGVKNGKAVISATYRGKKFTCKVTVKNLKINTTGINMEVGSTYALSIGGAAGVIWSSSNSNVASVSSSGLVTAEGAGTAEIIGIVGTQSFPCTVNVSSSVRLSASEVTLQIGGTYTLSVYGSSSYVDWSSSDSSIAKVSSSGKVTGVSEGTAAVTAYVGGRSLTSHITVKTAGTQTVIKKKVTTVTTVKPVNGVTTTETTTATENVSAPKQSSGGTTEKKKGGSREDAVYKILLGFKSRYPEGMTFTNADYRSWVGGIYRGGYGCAGFCFELSDAAFAPNLAQMRMTNLTKDLRPGDIIRLDYNTHSVIVLEVYDSYVIVAEANYNSSVHWGRKITFAEIERTGTNVITRYEESTAEEIKAVMEIMDQLGDLMLDSRFRN